MTCCADCFGHEGERETAVAYLDQHGVEHRREFVTLCGCPAGADLYQRSCTDPTAELTPHKRISFARAREGWVERIRSKGWTFVDFWVTSRTMPRLPEEARFTYEQRARIEQSRAAYRAAQGVVA